MKSFSFGHQATGARRTVQALDRAAEARSHSHRRAAGARAGPDQRGGDPKFPTLSGTKPGWWYISGLLVGGAERRPAATADRDEQEQVRASARARRPRPGAARARGVGGMSTHSPAPIQSVVCRRIPAAVAFPLGVLAYFCADDLVPVARRG